MQNEILNQRILKTMKAHRAPMAGGQIAHAIEHDAKEVRQALLWLMDAGKVWMTADGYRYELASGGYCPDGWPGGAA